MWSEFASQLTAPVAASGTTGLLGWIVGRHRNRADVAEKLTTIGIHLSERLEERLQTTESQFAAYKAAAEQREERRKAAATRHVQWDTKVAQALRDLGHEVPAPPPLEAA